MGLLIAQILFLARGNRTSHRLRGPAHGAQRVHRHASGEEDFLLVQNVVGTLWLGLILALAFALKKRRKVHGALLSSTLIVFLGPALFFSLIAFARPGEPAAFIIALVIMSAIRVRTVLPANPQREL